MKFISPQRTLDELSILATRLPWWGNLLCALAAYVLLHPIATLQLPAPIGMVDVVATSLGQLFLFLARAAQYLLPLAFLISATVSGFAGWKRNDLRESVVQDTTGSILRGLPWSDFALLVSDAFQRQGYELSQPRATSADQGATLELTRGNRRYLVDCAEWRSSRAGAGTLRKLSQRIEETGADGGFAVGSGQFTPEAKHFSADRNIELIDGRHLKELVRAAPESAVNERPAVVAGIWSFLKRSQEWISSRLGNSDRVAATWEEPKIRSHPGQQRRVHGALGGPAEESPITEDEEITAGSLTALIQAEQQLDDEIKISAPPVQIAPTKPLKARRPRRPIRLRKVADGVGILIALAILWNLVEWFSMLPGTPTDTPWALLGASRDSAALARRMQGRQMPASDALSPEGERPLGQFQFGPSGRIADLEAKAREREGYHSLRELEVAFDDKYVPPPECYAWESNDQMVKCGNHRIRARRDFIASGGEVTPALLGSWEEPRPALTQMRPRDWRHYEQQDWQDGVDQVWDPYRAGSENGQQEARGGWDPEPLPSADNDTDPLWDPEYTLEPDQDWQPGPGQTPAGSGWRRPESEEPIITTWDRTDGQSTWGDWRQESTREWRRVPTEELPLEPQEDWRQEWLRGPGPEQDRQWQQDRIQQNDADSAWDDTQDWRQEWQRGSQQESDQDWRRAWEAEPASAERRHWVDDP